LKVRSAVRARNTCTLSERFGKGATIMRRDYGRRIGADERRRDAHRRLRVAVDLARS